MRSRKRTIGSRRGPCGRNSAQGNERSPIRPKPASFVALCGEAGPTHHVDERSCRLSLVARTACSGVEADGQLQSMRLHGVLVAEHLECWPIGDDDAVVKDHGPLA
jgi:hypothetical protein